MRATIAQPAQKALGGNAMSRTLVWDVPIRLFHALFAAGVAAAAVISLILGEHSVLFPYHAIIGLATALLVCLRLLWGIIGSRYARFSSFAFGPAAVAQYAKGVLFGGGRRYVGHNPGSAYAIFTMLALMLGLAATGIVMGQGSESVKELHEILAFVMVGVAAAHVLGVIFHTIRHRDNVIASMIHGRKDVESAEGIRSSHPVLGIVFLAVVGAWFFGLVRSFDPVTQTARLPVLGTSLQVGEAENEADGADRERDGDD